MATSLVDELQLDASNDAVSVSSLLRKALVVAAKLEVTDVPEWISKELAGYSNGDTLPAYRVLHGNIKAKNPVRGWIPVQFPTNEMQANLSERGIFSSAAEIEVLSKRDAKLAIGFAPETQEVLQRLFQFDTEFACFIEQTRMDGILDAIRNQVLLWAIALDKAGVRGDGLSFTGPEKEKAHTINFYADSGSITVGVAGSAGSNANIASGTNAHVNVQSVDSSDNPIKNEETDMPKMAEELGVLVAALFPLARDVEHYAAIGKVASAELAAKEGKPAGVAVALSTLGTGAKWVLGVAKDVGVHVAEAAVKSYLSLLPK